MMLVKDILTNSVMCTSDLNLQEVVQMMSKYNLYSIPVVESLVHKNPIGVVTEKSICRRSIAEGLNPLKLTAGRVMNSNYKVVTPHATLENCYGIMKSCKVDYLVVTDENNVCCGIVTFEEVSNKMNVEDSFLPLNKFADYQKRTAAVDRIF